MSWPVYRLTVSTKILCSSLSTTAIRFWKSSKSLPRTRTVSSLSLAGNSSRFLTRSLVFVSFTILLLDTFSTGYIKADPGSLYINVITLCSWEISWSYCYLCAQTNEKEQDPNHRQSVSGRQGDPNQAFRRSKAHLHRWDHGHSRYHLHSDSYKIVDSAGMRMAGAERDPRSQAHQPQHPKASDLFICIMGQRIRHQRSHSQSSEESGEAIKVMKMTQ